MRKDRPARETITYPKVAVTLTYDPCHDVSFPYEHVLSCRHIVTTPEPNEPCAPNCHYATQTSSRQAQKMTLSAALQKEFYCDACVEEQAGMIIYGGDSCKQAEQTRINYRLHEAKARDKANNFRRCYIAQKVVSVPCDKDGFVVKDYDPYVGAHPFDTAWPPTGDNMFEDIDATPIKTKPNKKKRSQARAQSSPDEAALHIDDAVAEDVNATVSEGTRWLQEEEERERRRAEEGAPTTQRRRAAARPIIINSSPDTGMSSFVVDDSSLLTVQTNAQDESAIPAAAKKKRDQKRKKAMNDKVAATPAILPIKRVKATPKAPSLDSGTSTSTVDVPSGRTIQTGRGSDSHTGSAKKASERHKKRAANDEAATALEVQPTKRAKVMPKAPDPTYDYDDKKATTRQKTKDSTKGDTTRSKSKVTKKPSNRMCSVL